MVKYTLTYFNVRGLGEPIRLLFKYAGVDFKDVQITHDDWPKIKPTTLNGKLPFLEVDGKVLPESGAILRYLARQFKLIGTNEFEAAIADAALDSYRDFTTAIRPFFIVYAGFGEGNVDQLFKDVYIPNRDVTFKRLTEVISKSEFIVESGITFVDFVIADHVATLLTLDPEFEKSFPKIVAYQKKVFSLPQIKDYIASRNNYKF